MCNNPEESYDGRRMNADKMGVNRGLTTEWDCKTTQNRGVSEKCGKCIF
jgi:hypothetical protein